MTRPPRLCMVVYGEYPNDVRVARETRAALAAGFAVEVVATRGYGEPARESLGGVTVYRLPVGKHRDTGAVRFLVGYLAFTALATVHLARLALKRRPDIVQVHNPPDFLIGAGLVPRLLGGRLVLDVHDLSSDMFSMRFGDGAAARAAQRVLEGIERLACRMADAVLTVHEPYRAELARRGTDPDRILVVLNSLDETLLPSEPRPATPNPFQIVYHGTVAPHYGLEIVIDAFAQLPEWLSHATLEIIGDGIAVPQLARQAADLGVADRVELAGVALPQTEVLARIQGASVGVIPNLPTRLNRFALSTKLFEYVVLGIPVVVADLPTLQSHFSSEEVAYFRAGDAAALAGAIESVADDYASALDRAGAAIERYRAEYEWNRQARRYTRLLRLLAAGASNPARLALDGNGDD
jgi:glycosyltransferase involved in cell wall biosynthesis